MRHYLVTKPTISVVAIFALSFLGCAVEGMPVGETDHALVQSGMASLPGDLQVAPSGSTDGLVEAPSLPEEELVPDLPEPDPVFESQFSTDVQLAAWQELSPSGDLSGLVQAPERKLPGMPALDPSFAEVGEGRAQLRRSLLASPAERNLDLDNDGLVDILEHSLARAFVPVIEFSGAEPGDSRQPYEPVTVFQVRPVVMRDVSSRPGKDITVRIQYIFLFQKDGGYQCGWCDGHDSHAGDNDSVNVAVSSYNGGINWVVTHIFTGMDGKFWWHHGRPNPVGNAMVTFVGAHPKIYFSAGKHHIFLQYPDGASCNSCFYSKYSSWNCSDMIGCGEVVTPVLDSLEVRSLYGNNIGEPDAPHGAPFINGLSPYYPGHTIWNGENFYEVGPNRNKAMTFEKPLDLTTPVTGTSYGRWTSEEQIPPSYCPNGSVAYGAFCRGTCCDDMRLACRSLAATPQEYTWSSWFSEESPSFAQCDGGFVTGLACTGRYCDRLRIECTKFAGIRPASCTWTPFFSEEQGFRLTGRYIAGIRCSGNYCDNVSLLECDAVPSN